jgi:peptide/nickel transport system substrate-binding protein
MGAMGAVRKLAGAAGAVVVMSFGLGAIVASSPAEASSSSLPGQYGTLPTQSGTPINGGTVSINEPPSAGPTFIFPITPEANASVYTTYSFQDLSWRPLWWSPKGAEPEVDYPDSLAKAPAFSNDNKTVTITLKPWKWSDGAPVTSTDVEFDIDLLKAAVAISPANDGDYTQGLFPDNLASMSTPDTHTLVLTLTKTYNQNFTFLDQLAGAPLYALPSHAWAKTSLNGPVVDFTNPANAKAIYNFLVAQSNILATYGTNPLWQVVDGPFKISSFDASTDANSFVPNHNYSGPVKPRIAKLDQVAFTSYAAEFNQLLTGNLTVGAVDYGDLPQVSKLEKKGYSVWGYPNLGFNYVAYNFKDTTGEFSSIISQLYMRQALAHLQDEPAIIASKAGFDGAAGAAYGSVPAVPPTPFTPKSVLNNPYPFSISTASKLLSSHGWNVKPGGTTTCAKAGSGAGECGAGITKGTPLTFNLIYTNQPAVIGTEDEALASNAKQIGMTIKLQSKTFNYIINNLSDVSNPSNDNLWAMQDFGGFTEDLYPTTNELFNTGGSFNGGGFSNPKIDADIMASANSTNPNALKTELADVSHYQPGLFQPNPDLISAFKKGLSGPPASFAALSQYQPEPEYWYFTK